jgi:hypothetical protein
MNSSNVNATLLLALAKGARVFADSIEADMVPPPLGGTGEMVPGGRVAFDLRTEQPRKKADPHGTPEEWNMACLTYLGAIWLINKSEKRGATPLEVRKYAMQAGYASGREVNGFSNGENKATVSKDDGRWVTPHGARWLEELKKTLEMDLPDVGVGGEPD